MATAAADPYISRRGDEEIVDREDPVVWGSAEGPLGGGELDDYSRRGFLSMVRLFSAEEAHAISVEAVRLVETADRNRPEVVIEPDSNRVRSIFRLHRTNELFRSVCRDPRLLEIARQLLGSEVCIHQTRINFKGELDSREFFWHSDFETWHVEDGMPRMRAVTVSVALRDNTEFNGPLMVMPRSHELFVRCAGETPEEHYRTSLRRQEIGVPSRSALTLLADRGGLHAPKGPAGSATFFESNLMHGSAGNLSPWPRSNLFIVYNSVENGLEAPFGDVPPRPEFLAEREILPVSDL